MGYNQCFIILLFSGMSGNFCRWLYMLIQSMRRKLHNWSHNWLIKNYKKEQKNIKAETKSGTKYFSNRTIDLHVTDASSFHESLKHRCLRIIQRRSNGFQPFICVTEIVNIPSEITAKFMCRACEFLYPTDFEYLFFISEDSTNDDKVAEEYPLQYIPHKRRIRVLKS